MQMAKRSQNQNKAANLGIFDLFQTVEIANEPQTIDFEPAITANLRLEKEYKNILEVNILTPSCLNVLRKNYQVDFINGKYLVKW